MNYTGGPSISGCRPVLSLYPTHCFCQYLLLIFITFTNSSLFCRAFSTNSRSPLSHAAGVTAPPEGEELNLSVSADALPPPLPRGGFGIPQSERFRQRLPYQGQPRRPPPVAETGRSCWGSGQQDASGARRMLGAATRPWRGACDETERARPHRFLYLFGEKSGIMVLRPCPPILWEGR